MLLVLAVLLVVLGVFAVTRFVDFHPAPLINKGGGASSAPGARASGPAAATAAAASPSAVTSNTPSAAPVSIAGVQALDPQGDDNENNDLAARAIDGDPSTSWHSDRYSSPEFGGLKKGLGLAVDLGETSTVTSVTVTAPGTDGTVELRTADGPDIDGSTVVATGRHHGHRQREPAARHARLDPLTRSSGSPGSPTAAATAVAPSSTRSTSGEPGGRGGETVTSGDTRDDRALLAAHVAGDPEAFTVLVRRHRDRLWAVALRTMRDREEAADALQDALLSAFRNAAGYRGDAAVTTWLHRVVVNACLDRMRRRPSARPSPLADTDVPAPDDEHARPERRLDIAAALARLPEPQRVAIVLVDLQDLSVAEAAGVLGVAEGTVKSRCSRGRIALARLLGEPQEGEHEQQQGPGGNLPVAPRVAPAGPPGSSRCRARSRREHGARKESVVMPATTP